jgi:hypothetical protein
MDKKGQLTGVPIMLVMSLVIAAVAMGIMTQFMNTAERTALKDMQVKTRVTGNRLKAEVFDAQSGEKLGGTTMVVKYPGGSKAHTLGDSSNSYTFSIPLGGADYVIASLRVTRQGYIPWEGEIAVG